MYGIGRKFKRYFGTPSFSPQVRELGRISNYPKGKSGYTNILNRPFKFHDGGSFASTFKEIFQNEIYQFNPSETGRTILDCGANMGLSVLYFSVNYPDHKIIAFEPDAEIFEILKENIETFELKNVVLHQKAVWVQNETLKFYTDGGMGGRIDQQYADQNPMEIEAVPLLDYLSADVDFLKIDIEGAEDKVLKYCGENLRDVNNIFFEYHNSINSKQTLHELLSLVNDLGFHYYIKESYTRKRPFIDTELICESFDMAINVFCYRNNRLN